ncbi:hypothetical protein [uncultured Roseovarius sp.]|uniref:cyanase n=1 Tax=Roseovarius sp. TaxID=1486281 RepID=UPI00341CE485
MERPETPDEKRIPSARSVPPFRHGGDRDKSHPWPDIAKRRFLAAKSNRGCTDQAQSAELNPSFLIREYKVVGVYRPTIKAIIQEKFGDGIMSAIDFDMQITRIEHPKGDRVKIEMSGKYLGYNAW